jgi:hypothetical protein
MLASIALYPDDLLADILVAATYPLDVAEAGQWLEDPQNAALKGDQLFSALQQKSWDPSVKSLTPFPQILRMLGANLEWLEQLGEAYLADPAGIMDAVQALRHRAQSAGRLTTTPQGIEGAGQAPASIEEPITIEASNPDFVYVPLCDPSFTYGPWPYADYPPFVPIFAGATIGGCGWISGPIIAPFWGLVVLNFRARHIDIDHKRLALFDRGGGREKIPSRAFVEQWRHDPGQRGNVPYRNPAVGDLFGRATTPVARASAGFGARWTGLPPIVAPRAVALPQAWGQPRLESTRPLLDNGRRPTEGLRNSPELSRAPTAGAQTPLEGVNPTWERAQLGQPLDREAETRILIERGVLGRVPATALAPPAGGLRASPPFGGMGSTRSLGDRRLFRPLVGVHTLPYGFRGPSSFGVHPFNGQGPQTPFGGMRVGGGKGGG